MIFLSFILGTVTSEAAHINDRPSQSNRPSAHGLDKGDLVDLFQSGETAPYLVERRFPEEAHALFTGGFPNLRSRLPIQNHFADTVGQIQQFVDRGSAP